MKEKYTNIDETLPNFLKLLLIEPKEIAMMLVEDIEQGSQETLLLLEKLMERNENEVGKSVAFMTTIPYHEINSGNHHLFEPEAFARSIFQHLSSEQFETLWEQMITIPENNNEVVLEVREEFGVPEHLNFESDNNRYLEHLFTLGKKYTTNTNLESDLNTRFNLVNSANISIMTEARLYTSCMDRPGIGLERTILNHDENHSIFGVPDDEKGELETLTPELTRNSYYRYNAIPRLSDALTAQKLLDDVATRSESTTSHTERLRKEFYDKHPELLDLYQVGDLVNEKTGQIQYPSGNKLAAYDGQLKDNRVAGLDDQSDVSMLREIRPSLDKIHPDSDLIYPIEYVYDAMMRAVDMTSYYEIILEGEERVLFNDVIPDIVKTMGNITFDKYHGRPNIHDLDNKDVVADYEKEKDYQSRMNERYAEQGFFMGYVVDLGQEEYLDYSIVSTNPPELAFLDDKSITVKRVLVPINQIAEITTDKTHNLFGGVAYTIENHHIQEISKLSEIDESRIPEEVGKSRLKQESWTDKISAKAGNHNNTNTITPEAITKAKLENQTNSWEKQ